MFCLRSWLPLLFIPTNASPLFILLFFICTYFLNRPCVYCSLLLLILFASSCHWSDHCFFDFSSSNWFEPRSSSSSPTPLYNLSSTNLTSAEIINSTMSIGASETLENIALYTKALNNTAAALASTAVSEMRRRAGETRSEWTGIGLEWLRNLLGRREWRLGCMDIVIRL